MAALSDAQLINQDSGNVEWYTPPHIVEAARRVMGRIDLDPASSPAANQHINAAAFYTVHDDGLTQPWRGCVWMNHPFSRENNPRWIAKLISEYHCGRVRQACCITWASTSESWFQRLLAYPMCLLSPRTRFLKSNGRPASGATKGAAVTYLGPYITTFVAVFRDLGTVVQPAMPETQFLTGRRHTSWHK